MKQKKRLLTDAFLAVATVGMAAGIVWAEDGGHVCPEQERGGFIIPAFKCPTGMSCAYLLVTNEDGEAVGAAGACMGSPPQ